MAAQRSMIVDSPVGRREVDSAGSPVGVVRMEANKSYTGIGEVLQEFINNSNQQAWEKIKAKIDYTYRNLDLALRSLQKETGFSQEIKSRLARGQKLLFKPNLVMPNNIDPQTHGPDSGSTTCTAWPFIAALMRWFHDKLNISYHQMSLGEAATAMTACANLYSLLNQEGKRITTEAVIEGKSGNFYGGWGFYFVRKYLSECHAPDHSDNPMQGYEESVSGTYIPPGHASGKLMVYDLNRTYDDPGKGREVSVPGGVNFQSIILHKVVIGSNPEDSADLQAYPGCIFVNVPKLKVHTITLLTNAIKNLGIGLYPMEAGRESPCKWEYSWPHTRVPAIKAGIPHQVWVGEMDSSTGLPKRDSHGQYMAKKTGGITATMIDIIKAVKSQDILSIHIVDAIEAINLDHTGRLPGSKEPEGLVFAGLDPVATDLLCARYIFSNVPLEEASRIGLDDRGWWTFPPESPHPQGGG